jgi:quercetin dioxygenase-like cupin family protein
MSGYFIEPQSGARFSQDKFGKQDLFSGQNLFLGLNCFEPGQSHPVHAHAGADKFYYVISGRAVVTVGKVSQEVTGGLLVWAPADVPHGVSDVKERTMMLVGIAPPPRASRPSS